MRTFIGINFDEDIKEYLTEIQEKVKINCKGGNYTKRDNFHLTLRFMGEVKRDEIELLSEAVCEAGNANKKFDLTANELGFFTKGSRSIVWLGVSENKKLIRLFQTLEKSLGRQGFSRDKKGLSPHITLGRDVDLFLSQQQMKDKIKIEDKTLPINSISLLESARVGSNLVYRPIYTESLK